MERCYKVAGFSSELAVNIFMNSVLVYVCDLYDGNVQIVTEEDMNGREVHSNGPFEFVLKRERKEYLLLKQKWV